MTMKRSRYRKRTEYFLKNDSGVTMVEVLVAFTVRMIILGILYGMIAFSSILRMRAQDASAASNLFTQEMYNKANAPQKVPDGSATIATPYEHITVKNYVTTNEGDNDYTPLFYLTLSTEDTSTANLGSRGEAVLSQMKTEDYWLSLYNIEAITYVFKPDATMDAEHIIIPKAVKFIHKEDREYDE